MSLARVCAGILLSFTFAGVSFAQSLHNAEKIQCSFAPQFGQQKSMQASCSANPENTFSSRYDQHSATDHCNVTPLSQSQAFREFKIMVPLMATTWKHEFLADPEARERIIQRSMKDNDLTEDVANQRYDEGLVTSGFGKITAIQKIFDSVMFDPDTDEFYDPPRLKPALLVLMTTSNGLNYSVYVSATNDAVLTQYINGGDHSWVNMSFGRCGF